MILDNGFHWTTDVDKIRALKDALEAAGVKP